MNDGKLVIEGKIELLSPLHIGSGENDSTDLDVIKDADGKPYITLTSFIGALQHHLAKNYETDKNDLEKLFGFTKGDDSQGSLIIGNDLFLLPATNGNIVTRDGIKINQKTGIVTDKAKYDYQIVDKGAKFSFKLEAAYSGAFKSTLLKYFTTIIEMLKANGNYSDQFGLRIGAKTNNGLGKVFLVEEKLFDYDFSNSKSVIAWLKGVKPTFTANNNQTALTKRQNDFIIDGYFDLKTSLIQRSYNDDPSMPDASHIQSSNKNILAGSGAKGAIISRVRRIVNTIWEEDEDLKTEFLDNLLGYVYDKNGEEDKRKSKEPKNAKLQIEERELPAYITELQSRIKIDRFTGGTINGALFDSMPLFNTKELNESTDLGKKTRITITVKNYTEEEAGLLLLVLKDLWTGDIPIGGEKGIGRGVFNGVYATIHFGNETIKLEQGLNSLAALQKYVDALVKKTGVKSYEK